MADVPEYALSIKQPWATLVIQGLKTIEIRRWSTPRRGRIYIHTGQLADDRKEGWIQLPKKAAAMLKRRGGVIGSVELHEVVCYKNAEDFRADVAQHWNDPSWFVPPVMYGFRLRDPKIEPFREMIGNVRFFKVKT